MNVRQIFAILAGGLALLTFLVDNPIPLLAVGVLLLAIVVLIKEP
jgi:hypothetical protein